MNRILTELRAIVDRERTRWLPEVTDKDVDSHDGQFTEVMLDLVRCYPAIQHNKV